MVAIKTGIKDFRMCVFITINFGVLKVTPFLISLLYTTLLLSIFL